MVLAHRFIAEVDILTKPLIKVFLYSKPEKARLQAEAKAAEEARRRADEKAAAEGKLKRELEREAARQALLKVTDYISYLFTKVGPC